MHGWKIIACSLILISIVLAEDHGHSSVAPTPAKPKAKAVSVSPKATKPAAVHHSSPPPNMNADDALRKLVAGNQRFISATQSHPDQTIERRMELTASQKPFAVVVSCSDSRVPPEVIFDQGLGNLFVIRTAGEVVTDVEMGSIEYALEHVGVNLILVLGHERCGAVKATLDGGETPGSIGSICKLIQPAVDKAKFQGGDVLDHAVKLNVGIVADRIGKSPLVRQGVATGRVKLVRAYYDLDEGTVKPVP